MALFLLESNDLSFASSKQELEDKAKTLNHSETPTLVEVQATENLTHGYFIVELMTKQQLKNF